MLEMHKYLVRIASGPGQVKSFRDHVFEYNVALRVLGGIALWHHKSQLQKNPSRQETILPQITIHLGHKHFKWSDLQLPANAPFGLTKNARRIEAATRISGLEPNPNVIVSVVLSAVRRLP